MAPDPLRLAIVGTGAIASRHVKAITAHPDDVVVTAICDPNPAATAAMSAALPEASIFTDLEELFSSGVFDAGIVATPHFLHFEQAFAFARARIPVLVEKPLVTNLDDLRALRDIAADTNTLVVAGQMHRFDRTNVLARRWLDGDPERFGELESFELTAWQDISEYTAKVGETHWLLDGDLAGGGVVTSLAIHQLDLVRYLGATDFAEVSARGRFSPPFRSGAESSASILVTMTNGATGTMFASYNAPRAFSCEFVSLFGEKGGLTRQIRERGEYLGPLLYAPAHSDVEGILDLSAAAEQGHPEVEPSVTQGLSSERFENQILHFAAAVKGEVAPVNSIEQNFNSIACIDAINESIRKGGRNVLVAQS